MARLILIRHGQTDYNLQSKYCGFSNPPLNEKGVEQAQKLYRDFKKKLTIDKVYSSDLQRALKTAKIALPNLTVEKKTDFREMNFGLFEGLKYREITRKYPKIYQNWIKNPLETETPGGESLKTLSERVRKGLKVIFSENKDKTIALVTHEGPIKIITLDKQKRDLKDFWDINHSLGTYSIIKR